MRGGVRVRVATPPFAIWYGTALLPSARGSGGRYTLDRSLREGQDNGRRRAVFQRSFSAALRPVELLKM